MMNVSSSSSTVARPGLSMVCLGHRTRTIRYRKITPVATNRLTQLGPEFIVMKAIPKITTQSTNLSFIVGLLLFLLAVDGCVSGVAADSITVFALWETDRQLLLYLYRSVI